MQVAFHRGGHSQEANPLLLKRLQDCKRISSHYLQFLEGGCEIMKLPPATNPVPRKSCLG